MAAAEDGPTQRDFANLSNSIRDNTQALREFSEKVDATYVRKDVLGPQLAGVRKEIGGVVADVETHSKYFTWLVQTAGSVIIVGLLSLLIYTGVHR